MRLCVIKKIVSALHESEATEKCNSHFLFVLDLVSFTPVIAFLGGSHDK